MAEKVEAFKDINGGLHLTEESANNKNIYIIFNECEKEYKQEIKEVISVFAYEYCARRAGFLPDKTVKEITEFCEINAGWLYSIIEKINKKETELFSKYSLPFEKMYYQKKDHIDA